MENINRFNDIINYIEDNFEKEIEIDVMAKAAQMSVYEFRRIFSFVAGVPVSEYIRKRRLSAAAEELMSGEKTVTEVALKYGYDSASSFSRAFKAFHGIAPTEISKSGSTINMYTRIGFDFSVKGGWVVDQQSMETIHSSYLIAHGMGISVEDATGEVEVAESGVYNIWVRTRDWTAVWNVKDSAGKFKLLVDGRETEHILGTNGAEWGWQKAGEVELSCGIHEIGLRDLTGFNGRCDAIYMTTGSENPSDDIDSMRQRLSWKEVKDGGEYELIVAGGGIAGICTALSAIRGGVNALLIHDREVLGGCNSSEVRVCMGGLINLPPYPKLGDVVKEIAPVMGTPAKYDSRYFEDDRKLFAFEASNAEKSVVFNECVTGIEKSGDNITAVITTNVITGAKTRYKAKLSAVGGVFKAS